MLRWLADIALHLCAVVLSLWAASWPNLSMNPYRPSPLLDWAGFIVMLWVVSVPVILTRPCILFSLRNPSSGSLSRINYLAGSLVLSVIWFVMVAVNMTIVGRLLGVVVMILSHILVMFVTPVRLHRGGRLGESE
jgi:hypothetical protein